jgi:hypothetical protein
LDKQLKKVIRQQDKDGKIPFSFLEKASRKKVRRIEKIMGKRSAGNNHRDRRHLSVEKSISQQVLNTLQEINQLKATRTYYTSGSIRDNMVVFGVHCEEDKLEESYNICEDIPTLAVELTAIQIWRCNT